MAETCGRHRPRSPPAAFSPTANTTASRVCAVKQAVGDGRLPAERLASLHKLGAKQEALTARQDVIAQQVRKKRDKIGARAIRTVTKMKGRT